MSCVSLGSPIASRQLERSVASGLLHSRCLALPLAFLDGCWCSLVIGRSRRGILWSLPFVDVEVAAVIEIYGGGAAMA